MSSSMDEKRTSEKQIYDRCNSPRADLSAGNYINFNLKSGVKHKCERKAKMLCFLFYRKIACSPRLAIRPLKRCAPNIVDKTIDKFCIAEKRRKIPAITSLPVLYVFKNTKCFWREHAVADVVVTIVVTKFDLKRAIEKLLIFDLKFRCLNFWLKFRFFTKISLKFHLNFT